MEKQFILAIDQGTSSCRALLVDKSGKIVASAQKEFEQHFPQPGWVEHDPMEIWEVQLAMVHGVLEKNGSTLGDVAAIGITNQRETTVVWDKETGEPLYNAIVWQDKRTSAYCDELKAKGLEETVRTNTGLVIDAYFSGTKLRWVLENVVGARQKAEAGQLLFGTIDTWLMWKLSNGKIHATDYTNASRTMLYNIVQQKWDETLLSEMNIPTNLLPTVHPSSFTFGQAEIDGVSIPICGVAGDQQSALFGQACFSSGMAKNTYGTGCFMLLHTGDQVAYSKNGLLTTMACSLDEKPQYALEGSVFVAGAAIQWLRDGLKIIDDAKQTTEMVERVAENDEVYVVPAFAGLGAPYWDQYARGAIFGLTRDVNRDHFVKATLESLAYQSKDVLEAMEQDAGIQLSTLKVDGGAVANDYLMQFQADILDAAVERPTEIETTALGAAYLAGIAIEWWSKDTVIQNREIDKTFQPVMKAEKRQSLYKGWQKAVERTRGWKEKPSA